MSSSTLQTIADRISDRRNHLTALNRFGKFLGRDPDLSDLTDENYERFCAWLTEQGIAAKQQDATRWRLRSIWRRAIEAGKAGPLPPTRKAPPQPKRSWENAELPERSLSWFLESVYRPLRLRGRAANTLRLYRFTVRNFGDYLGRHATLDDLTDELVSGMLTWMAERGRSPHTRQKELWQLQAFWNFAHRKRLIEHVPDVQPEKLPKRAPEAWLMSDLVKLWEGIKAADGAVSGIPSAAWFAALHHIVLCSGERIGAVLALRWSDFDAETGWITFRAEYRKGGRADNKIKASAVCIEALERIRLPERDLILPWDRNPTYLWTIYGNILKAAGLPADARSKFHRLRRTVASYYEAAGGNATALLTHTSRQTTERYLDPRIVQPQQVADLLADLVNVKEAS